MTEKKFEEFLVGFNSDKNPGWIGHIILYESISKAIENFGIVRVIIIMKKVFGD